MKKPTMGSLYGLARNSGRMAALSAFLLFSSQQGFTQAHSVHNYYYNFDTKHYSIEQVDNTPAPNDEYVMLGTVQGVNAQPGIHPHFMHTDEDGDIITNDIYIGPSNSVPEYGVDIVFDGVSDYYSVCLQNNGGTDDRIKLLLTNLATGLQQFGTFSGLNNTWTIKHTNGNFPNMIPLHSLMFNGNLYICGYVCDTYGDQPYYGAKKRSFVLSIDPPNFTTAGGGVNWLLLFESSPVNVTPDFDIAMRLKAIGNDLFVLGSCNRYFSIQGANKSASLVLKLDIATPGINADWSFLNRAATVSDVRDEFAMDITDVAGDYYVLGNYFRSNFGNKDFSTDPTGVWLTHLLSTGPTGSATNNERQEMDPSTMTNGTAWGLRLLPATSGNFTIAGMQNGEVNPCSPNYVVTPSYDDIDPFLADMAVIWTISPGVFTSATVNSWNTYTGQSGTGSFSGSANSYPRLFRGLANFA